MFDILISQVAEKIEKYTLDYNSIQGTKQRFTQHWVGNFYVFKWQVFWFLNTEKLQIQMSQYLLSQFSFIFLQILKVSQFNLKSFCKHYTFPSQNKRIYSYFPFHQTKMRYLCLYYIFQQLESVYIFVMYRNRVIYLINEVYYIISLYHRTLSQDICHEACSLLYAWRNCDTSA